MVEFVTLLLGALAAGPTHIELEVHSEVAAVEVRLDGHVASRLTGPPWALEVDFGEALLPHILEAVAFAADGSEVSRARQWINLTPKQAELTIALDRRESSDDVKALLSWESLSADNEPVRATVLFDGQQLEALNPRIIDLPAHDPDHMHHLSVELEFADSTTAAADITFGGVYGDQLESGLSAFPLLLEDLRGLPDPDRMKEWFFSGDRPLSIHSAEKGVAEIIVVRSRRARRLLSQMARQQGSGPQFPILKRDHRLRILGTTPVIVDREQSDFFVFPRSEELEVRVGGLLRILAHVEFPEHSSVGASLADAVAVAGQSAYRSARRRAVVLVTTGESRDASQFTPERVRGYLASIGVPLFVWTPEENRTEAGRWGTAANISTSSRLDRAYRQLTDHLDRQRIVWLTGLHLPQSIVLNREVEGVAALR